MGVSLYRVERIGNRNKLNDVVKALTGVDPKTLQENDSLTVNVPINKIIIESKKMGSQSYDISKSNMNNLLRAEAVNEPARQVLEIISIITNIVSIVVTVWSIVRTYQTTTTYSDGSVETETYTEETPVEPPAAPECCAICGEQLIPGQKHYCK